MVSVIRPEIERYCLCSISHPYTLDLLLKNPTRQEIIRAADRFRQRCCDDTFSVFFFAGHAVEIDGTGTDLIPCDYQPPQLTQQEQGSISDPLAIQNRKMDKHKERSLPTTYYFGERCSGNRDQYHMVILDACRNDPGLTRGLLSASRNMAFGARGPPMPVNMSEDMSIHYVYSTAPGAVALDGDGHSPFTSAFLQVLQDPIIAYETIFEVFILVNKKTRPQQTWQNVCVVRPKGDKKVCFVKDAKTKRAPRFPKGPKGQTADMFREKAQSGDTSALFNLALCYEKGWGVETNDAEAFKFYKLSANQGLANAQHKLGDMLSAGQGVSKNNVAACEWYEKAAEQGLGAAQVLMASKLYHGGGGVDKNVSKAIDWWKKAADQGDVSAQRNLAVCFKYGQGVSKNLSAAFKYASMAAENGNVTGAQILARCYCHGNGTAVDKSKATKWALVAAEKGDSDARFLLSFFYKGGWEAGYDVEKNLVKAAELLRLAAGQGNAQAALEWAKCLEYGQGIKQDFGGAAKIYREHADKGDTSAMIRLSAMYKYGRGVGKDWNKCEFLLFFAANLDDAEAQYQLWLHYMEKHGRDLTKFKSYTNGREHYLLALAVGQGHKKAAEYFRDNNSARPTCRCADARAKITSNRQIPCYCKYYEEERKFITIQTFMSRRRKNKFEDSGGQALPTKKEYGICQIHDDLYLEYRNKGLGDML